MNETFDSVLLFYSALKSFLMDSVGLTLARELSAHDVILTNGAGVFLRLQKKTNGAVASVGVELGADADTLELSTRDPELWFPFDTAGGGLFQAQAFWFDDVRRADVTIMASGDAWSKRYRASLFFAEKYASVVHQDHLNQTTEPNFKERGGTYVQAGV
jgi:hypothetical protein